MRETSDERAPETTAHLDAKTAYRIEKLTNGVIRMWVGWDAS